MSTTSTNQRHLLLKCLLISLGLHLVGALLFYSNPQLLYPSFNHLFTLSKTIPQFLEYEEEDLDTLRRNRMLEEAFKQVLVQAVKMQRPLDLNEIPEEISHAPHIERSYQLTALKSEPNTLPEELLFRAPKTASIVVEEVDGIEPLFQAPDHAPHIAAQLEIDQNIALPEVPSVSLPTSEAGYGDFVFPNELAIVSEAHSEECLNLAPFLPSSANELAKEELVKINPSALTAHIALDKIYAEQEATRATLFVARAPAPRAEAKKVDIASASVELEKYEFPEFAMAKTWNEHFDLEVSFLPTPEGKGYIFSARLSPQEGLEEYALKQNIYFIIDRTNSMQKHRFGISKRAIIKALATMEQADSFNILIIDKSITRFSAKAQAVTMKNIRAAEEFLEKQSPSGLFASGDIYTSLDKLFPEIEESEEVHTAILLSDGKTSLSAERQQKALQRWIEKNQGNVTLYAATSGRENDLISLDLLSTVSGGRLVYSDTHASLSRKLAKLILDLRAPVAKDLVVTATPHHAQAHIALYPFASQLAPLNGKLPYTFIGQIDHPSSFDLMVQGRHRNQWISIKKSISFDDAEKGDQSLLKAWDEVSAHLSYAQFLDEGKKSHLREAKEILKKTRSHVAFE